MAACCLRHVFATRLLSRFIIKQIGLAPPKPVQFGWGQSASSAPIQSNHRSYCLMHPAHIRGCRRDGNTARDEATSDFHSRPRPQAPPWASDMSRSARQSIAASARTESVVPVHDFGLLSRTGTDRFPQILRVLKQNRRNNADCGSGRLSRFLHKTIDVHTRTTENVPVRRNRLK